MALRYGGKIFRSLEEQVRANMEDISEIDGRVEKLEEGTSGVGGGEAVIFNGIEEATQGTLTAEQLAKLQESTANYIQLNNEIYLLMDKQTADGYLTYSHVGISNNVQYVKTITITISALSWVLVETELGENSSSEFSMANWETFTFENNVYKAELKYPTDGKHYIAKLELYRPSAARINNILFKNDPSSSSSIKFNLGCEANDSTKTITGIFTAVYYLVIGKNSIGIVPGRSTSTGASGPPSYTFCMAFFEGNPTLEYRYLEVTEESQGAELASIHYRITYELIK